MDGENFIENKTLSSQALPLLNMTTSNTAWPVASSDGDWTTELTTLAMHLKHEHDTNPSSESCIWYEIIVQGIISVTVSFFGIICNTLSILVFWPDRNKSAIQVLLLQLAVVDSLVLITWVLMVMVPVVRYNVRNPGDWFLAVVPYAYKYGWGIANMIQMVAVWLIVIVTAHRYVAVCHPHKMRLVDSAKVAWIQLAVLSVVCVLFNIPRMMEYDIVTGPDGSTSSTISSLGSNKEFRLWYRSISLYLMIFVIPVGLLVFFTISLIRQLRASKMKVKTQPTISTITAPAHGSKSTKWDKSNDDITFALIIVDIIFIICQLPNPLRRLLNAFITQEDTVCGTPYFYFAPWSGLGILVNSATNFVVFCLCGTGFRKKVKQRLCSKYAAVNASGVGKSTTVTNPANELTSTSTQSTMKCHICKFLGRSK